MFTNIANLLKKHRKTSQTKLSEDLGYKNGQFVSNIERGLCGLPLKKAGLACNILKINKSELRAALIADYIETLDNVLYESEHRDNLQQDRRALSFKGEESQGAATCGEKPQKTPNERNRVNKPAIARQPFFFSNP